MNKMNIWLVIVPLVMFAMLTVFVLAGITVRFEGWAYSETVEHISPIMTSVVKVITYIGDPAAVITICLILFFIPKSRMTIALPISAAVIISALLNVILKDIFARERPNILRLINETSYSFPSGHAMINSTLYTMFILLIIRFIKNKPMKMALAIACVILTIAIGFSRVYLGVHYAGDVLGGWLIGFVIAFIVYSIWLGKPRNLKRFTKN